ncbi:MAG: hypothetical protein LPH21_12570 [Shewanella sp.]|nr:hypothetical protein [Shewanella sp.]
MAVNALLLSLGSFAKTMSWGSVLTAGAAIVQMGASVAGKESMAATARYNAALAKNQQELDSYRLNLRSRSMAGQNRVAWAKSGVKFTGSPLLIAAQNAGQMEIDALTIQQRGQYQTSLLRGQAKEYDRASKFAIGTSLLTAASRIKTSES